jgi:hypothetical protein
MKQKRVLRYYCDHCKKSGCNKAAIRDHEAKCFHNPNRHCPICEAQWPLDGLIAPMAALVDIDEKNEETLIQAISDAVDGCPACICAALLQGPIPTIEVEHENWDGSQSSITKHRYWVTWNYKKAMDEYMSERRSEEASYIMP